MNRAQDPSALNEGQRANPLRNYQFSKEELKVLEQCNTDSIIQRSIPLGTLFGLTAYHGVKSGFFRASARFGAKPKVIGAMVLGYILGKISYQGKCAEKLMALPGSYVGQVLRERRNKGIGGGSFESFDSPRVSLFGNTNTDVYSDVYKDAGPNSSLDLDTDRPLFKGLEDTYKPSVDNYGSSFGNDDLPLPKTPGMSYDDLRKKNREEHTLARPQPYKIEPGPPLVRPQLEPTRKNTYGDTFEE